jgi:hypothetical protein
VTPLLNRGKRDLSRPDAAVLRRNLAYVLHEREQSDAVSRLLNDCLRHRSQLRRLRGRTVPVVGIDTPDLDRIVNWISATVGVPERLNAALADLVGASPQTLTYIDDSGPLGDAHFFRGTARLALPTATRTRVGVAALVLRPDGRSAQLNVTGVFDWPDETSLALQAVERLIQPFAGQWLPQRALWHLPVEQSLPGEIIQ